MSAPLKNIEICFNKGLGRLPVSIIVDFYDDESVNIDDLYHTIKLMDDIRDIIFRENTPTNKNVLSWVTPKLISEGYFVSIFSDTFIPISYNRLITTIYHPNEIRKNINFLQKLIKMDIIILDVDSIDHLILCRKLLLKSQIEAMVMFNSTKVLCSQTIDAKIYDIAPIGSGV